MDARHDEKRTNVEVDRLSSLPDDLIHTILSLIGLKNATKTSSLSSRWKFIWTSTPCLDFSILDFSTFPEFSDYVTHVLSRRDNLAHLFSIKLRFSGDFNQECFKQIINYAFSHNIQQLDIACLLENSIKFPLSLFNSHSLKHLSLTREFKPRSHGKIIHSRVLTTTSTWELPALTTLHLNGITLCCDDENTDICFPLFSKCANLKNLSLSRCRTKGWNKLSISNPQLINLKLENDYGGWKAFNVVTPKLKNLTIRNPSWERSIISAPELITLCCNGYRPLHLSTGGLNSLEKVDLCVSGQTYEDALGIVSLFHNIKSVKFLRLNLEIAELLSSHVEIISNHPSPFTNLKMLKLYPELVSGDVKVNMSSEVKNYLLDSSPGATFTMVTREEIRAIEDTKSAQKQMAYLRGLLKREKANIEDSKVHMEQLKKQVQTEGKVKHVNKCWNSLIVQIAKGREKTREIIAELKEIKGILKKLPTSNREELGTCFSSLCVEADAVVNDISDNMKIQCDNLQELASMSQSSP